MIKFLKISAKAPKRRFRSQKCDAEIEIFAEAEVEVPLLRRLKNLSQCDRALSKVKVLTLLYCHSCTAGTLELTVQQYRLACTVVGGGGGGARGCSALS